MKVTFSPEVEDYLFELIEILYEKAYFSYKENATKYVIQLVENIETTIHLRQKHVSPKKLKMYGDFYKQFRMNKKTTWYAFYCTDGFDYVITHITNNHTKESKYLLNRSRKL